MQIMKFKSNISLNNGGVQAKRILEPQTIN